MCRLAALAYGLRLINEYEERLGLPLPNVSARTVFQQAHSGSESGTGALVKFVQTKADQIYFANFVLARKKRVL